MALAALSLMALPTPVLDVALDGGRGERKPAPKAGKAEILFDSRQQRRAREREKPVAVPTPRKRRK